MPPIAPLAPTPTPPTQTPAVHVHHSAALLFFTGLLALIAIGAGAYYLWLQRGAAPVPVQTTATSTSSEFINSEPSISITNISGSTITIVYTNLATTELGTTSPSSLWVQNEGLSNPSLRITLDGAASGTVTFTLPVNAPTGLWDITPVGIPTSGGSGGPGGYMAYTVSGNIVSANFDLSAAGSITVQ